MLKFRILLLAMLLGLTLPLTAQVYKSIDAEGNATFSDTPSKEGEKVTIQESNTVDSVEVPPPSPKVKERKSEDKLGGEVKEVKEIEEIEDYNVDYQRRHLEEAEELKVEHHRRHQEPVNRPRPRPQQHR